MPIHKWRPMRPLRSPVAFLAIKEPPEGSCWVKTESPPSSPHQDWVVGGITAPPQKQNGEETKTCIKTVN